MPKAPRFKPADWSAITWADFVDAVTTYRERFPRQAREDDAYARCLSLLRGEPSMRARARRSPELVRFLNAWGCRLDRVKAPPAFAAWTEAHADELEAVSPVALTDARVPALAGEVDRLYDSVMGLRTELRNMSGAAASKALHQLVPDLFVMWDRTVRLAAEAQGHATYGAYLTAMHELSGRVLREAGIGLAEAEEQLGRTLGYPVRRPLAKYVDEANVIWIAA